MSDVDVKKTFEELDAVLETERKILLAGEIDRLAELLPLKAFLIDGLNNTAHDQRDTLQRLDGKVRRNQLLLDSAMEGIRTVSRRLATLRRVRGSLETYDSTGRKRRIEIDAGTNVEKRA